MFLQKKWLPPKVTGENPLIIISLLIRGFLTLSEIIYDKPFKTYDEQIEILLSRNISIPDHNFARMVLSSLSYYTIINGYKNTFLSVPGTDNFIEGTNFNDLYTLHMIETNVNSLVLKNILFVEQYLKTKIAYLVSEQYGVYTNPQDLSNRDPADYLCRNNYSRSNSGRNNILRQLKGTLTSDRINDSVAHYANTRNHVPAWILVTNITFGLTIKWYNILSTTDKARICSEFIQTSALSVDDKKEFLSIALDLLRRYRNKIAHGSRVFNLSGLPVLPKRQLLHLSYNVLSADEYNRDIGKSDLFAVILACFILIDNRYILINFLRDLMYTLNPYINIRMNNKSILEILGLPNDLFDRLDALHKQKFS